VERALAIEQESTIRTERSTRRGGGFHIAARRNQKGEDVMDVTENIKRTFNCRIVEIKCEGKNVRALDAPVASWEIVESFSEGKFTVYRLSGLGPNGERFTAEMTAKDLDYSGYGWPAAMNEDLVIPTFEKLLEGAKENQ
jgi:hypothetical protein